eukprot:scaffold162703_cov39-Prasinocladus_malaysianus.AAC.2
MKGTCKGIRGSDETVSILSTNGLQGGRQDKPIQAGCTNAGYDSKPIGNLSERVSRGVQEPHALIGVEMAFSAE